MVNKLSFFGRGFGRGIGSVAKEEMVGKATKSKEGINSEGQTKEALVEEPFYPVTGAMACVFWATLMTNTTCVSQPPGGPVELGWIQGSVEGRGWERKCV